MPIYEYRCAACGSEHESLQKFTDAPLTTCPSCHKDALTKLLSAAGFQLKGSGWYVTDFRNANRPAGKSATADAKEAKAEGSGDGKTDAKPSEGSAATSSSSESTSAASPATPPVAPAAKSTSE